MICARADSSPDVAEHCPHDPVLQAIRLLPRRQIVELLERIVAASAADALDACSELLAQAVVATVQGRLDLEPADLLPAATVLVHALPGDPARVPQTPLWSGARAAESGVVVGVMALCWRRDSRPLTCPLCRELKRGDANVVFAVPLAR
jgi:hypothetical protein